LGVGAPLGAALADWSGKSEAGVVISSGNTNTKAANGKLDLTYDVKKWKFIFDAAGVYASDDTGTTGQRWDVKAQHEYNFNPHTFWFNSARYENDRFSGFLYQATLGTGVGHRFFDRPDLKLTAQTGVGYKMAQSRDSLAEDGVTFVPGETDREAIFQGGIDYEQTLTATTKLMNKFLTEAGSENIFLQDDLSLQVKITQVLALAVGYTVRHNTKPPEGFKNTDTLTTLNLVYEFK
jgi:putative salt-induced outer membrane protein